MKKIALAAMVLLLLISAAAAQYQLGDTVADFTLLDAYGNPFTLYDYTGKIAFFVFWYFT